MLSALKKENADTFTDYFSYVVTIMHYKRNKLAEEFKHPKETESPLFLAWFLFLSYSEKEHLKTD